jgi:hypothetical protein
MMGDSKTPRGLLRRLLIQPAAGAASLLLVIVVLQRPAALFVNLGAGDAPFARGFRGGWERDGLAQSGETMFRWTQDGSRLEIPLEIASGRPRLRMRLARFAPDAAEIRLFSGERLLERWIQPSRGFSLRLVDLGELRGRPSLRFRSDAPGESLGVALDWVEVIGAERVWPARGLWPGLLALFVLVPLSLGLLVRPAPALALTALLGGTGVAAVLCDRLGGLVALASAGPPALVLVALLAVVQRAFVRFWAEQFESGGGSMRIALAAPLVALVALLHPFFYYPDIDTHARFVAALRSDPYLAVDPRDFQARSGAWTREISGRQVAFPYSPAFHLAALPLAAVFSEVVAIKLLAVAAIGVTLLLVHALARALGLSAVWAVIAQLMWAFLPVTASRLTLALYPALLGQTLETLLGLHLVRRFPHLDGARDAAALAFFLVAAQAGYTGSLFNVGALVLVLAALQGLAGERRRSLRLVLTYVAATAAVVVLQYASFLATAVRDVLPQALSRGAPAEAGAAGLLSPLLRLHRFYDLVSPALCALGLVASRRAPPHPRRYLAAALIAGLALLGLRFALPVLFRDVKEVELLAAPVAVFSACALAALFARGRAARGLGALALAGALAFGALHAYSAYTGRFVAEQRGAAAP